MRTILVLLLLANLTLFGYTRLDGIGGGEAVRLTQQVLPDKIKLLAPREVAALGPTKVAAWRTSASNGVRSAMPTVRAR